MDNVNKEYGRVWSKFERLAALGEVDRQRAYHEDGMQCLESLFRYTTIRTPPTVMSAEDFSKIIVGLRDNYRQWNQYLMSLMTASYTDGVASRTQLFDEFIAECTWVVLIDAARNFCASLKD
jgi:hypothetical protein